MSIPQNCAQCNSSNISISHSYPDDEETGNQNDMNVIVRIYVQCHACGHTSYTDEYDGQLGATPIHKFDDYPPEDSDPDH